MFRDHSCEEGPSLSHIRSTAVRWGVGSAAVLATVIVAAGCSTTSSAQPQTSESATVVNGHNSQDATFLTDMVAHHQQAIDMAEMVPSHTSSAQLKSLAARIEAAQGPEIAKMNGWLGEWSEGSSASSQPTSAGGGHDMSGMDHGSMDHAGPTSSAQPMGPGMMSAREMADLESKSGASFDRTWLTMMIAHHEGAIAMSQQELAQGENAQVKTVAQAIIDGQTKEIAEMKAMLNK